MNDNALPEQRRHLKDHTALDCSVIAANER